MAEVFFKHVRTGQVVSAYQYQINVLISRWLEKKEKGLIPEDSSEFEEPNFPSKREVTLTGIQDLYNNDDYYRIL